MTRTQTHSSNRPPLAIDPDREQRVRERAYHLWEADGKPHGRDVEYWERARELIGTEDSAGTGRHSNPHAAADQPRPTDIDEADTRASNGDFLNRPADKGEAKANATPKRRARAKSKKPV
jgi:hypothetical protein